MCAAKQVGLALGTDAWTTDAEQIKKQEELLKVAKKYGVNILDTARLYAGGASESAIGDMPATKDLSISAKLPGGFAPDGSTAAGVLKYTEQSLEALKVEKVQTYFIHAPNPAVPISETLDALQSLYKQGKFEKLGLSNFTLEQVKEAHAYAKAKGYVLPTVVQPMYSLVARKGESEMFPALRALGISIHAYAPIATGFLAKTAEDIVKGTGRWDPAASPYGKVLQRNYNRPLLLAFLRAFTALAERTGISQIGLAYRWVRYSSMLRGDLGDVVIIGASSAVQLEQTLKALEEGPLDAAIVKELDGMWKKTEGEAPDDNYVALMGLIAEGAITF